MRKAHPRRLLVAIDGPAGVGKSTVAKGLAARLGYHYLDTGALYRSLAWKIEQRHLDPNNPEDIQALLAQSRIRLVPERQGFTICIDGEPIDQHNIRTPKISEVASTIAAIQSVREWLLPTQKEIDHSLGVVAEGRDMGTRVFPDADVKFFLDAELGVRARRRQQELATKGEAISLETVQEDMVARDHRDRTRATDPLRPAHEAIMLDTSHRTVEEIIEHMLTIITDRL